MNWAEVENNPIKDLKDFTATFFAKKTLLNILINYSVFDSENTLLIMRPYQIAATERIIWKVTSSYQAKNYSKPTSGGYIWHATGSGKTLTSFKAARLATTNLDFIDKVFFIVDRKDLDYQTIKEYQKFSPDSVNGSNSTKKLESNLNKNDNKIIVTTIQKFNNLIKTRDNLSIYNKHILFIFDECHRSQFGEAQKNLEKRFKYYYRFGFTGTPIFKENALKEKKTSDVFGDNLHSYLITNAICDEKILKFKVDYNDVRPQFRAIETEKDEDKLSAEEHKKALLHKNRIEAISQYILDNFYQKTHRLQIGNKGFNALFAVSNIDAAKLYYETLNKLQKDSKRPLKIATIFSFKANEEQDAFGGISDESYDVSAMNSSDKEFLGKAIKDYNTIFKTSFNVDSDNFQNYYRDLAKRVKSQEIDLLIVVGMFLTGFDAPALNTLFIDRNLRYHSLIQAYSRTNRIYNATKTFGNIVTFRDLEEATIDAIRLFGNSTKNEDIENIILEKSYQEYMNGFKSKRRGEELGFIKLIEELEKYFPDPCNITKEEDKKSFIKLFGEYLHIENILKNYDEFTALKSLQNIDINNQNAIDKLKEKYSLSDEDLSKMKIIQIPTERKIQDYLSAYNDIKDWFYKEKTSNDNDKSSIDWSDIVFEVDLLKSQEIDLDYILEQIFEKNKKIKDKSVIIEDIKRMIKSSIGSRAKESLVVDFINEVDLDKITNKENIIDEFFTFAQEKQKYEIEEFIKSENLNKEKAKHYISASIKREFATENGTELSSILPKMSPLSLKDLTKKRNIFKKIEHFVKKFKGIGGKI